MLTGPFVVIHGLYTEVGCVGCLPIQAVLCGVNTVAGCSPSRECHLPSNVGQHVLSPPTPSSASLRKDPDSFAMTQPQAIKQIVSG